MSTRDRAEELGRTKAELHKALVELARLAAERDTLDLRVREFSAWAGQALARSRERDAAIGAQDSVAGGPPGGGERLNQLEGIVRQTATAIQAFHSQFDHDLQQHRGQRAWKVMLFFRRAYTLLVRQGWPGRLRFAKSILGLSGAAADHPEDYELQFPDILSYIPSALFAPSGNSFSAQATAMARARLPVERCARPLSRHDVIILPVCEFDFRFQRPQHLAQQLAAQGHRVFWISPARTLPLEAECPYEVVELRENLWEVHVRARLPDIYRGELGQEDVRKYFSCLRELYRDCAIGASCVLIELPFWRRIALALRESLDSRIVYDCMDDWETMPDLSQFVRDEEEALARECDVLTVTSRQLFAKYEDRGLRPVLAPNGVDFEFFSAAQPEGLLAHIPKPVVGYFGAIAERFDYDLLCEVARSRPRYSFVLIGGLRLEQEVRGRMIAKLKELPNVYTLGHKPYVQIPSYLAGFDACIIPFILNQVTKATDPVKLYEYLSQGKPVVTTAMGELAEHAELVHIASDATDFARKLDVAVNEGGTELKLRRIKFASENTWSHRIRALEPALNAAFPMLSVVIVTHNSAEYAGPCLDSLRRNTDYPSYEVIVVDNDSQDGTAELVARHAALDSRVRLLRQPNNTGFAAGTNLGVRHAKGESLVLLNMDTVVTPAWMERLIRHLRRDPSVGMVVPVTNWAGNEVRIDVPYANLREMEEFSLSLARENMGIALDIRMGPLFCALIPRVVWDKVGELDERFEVGMFEDDDLSHRMAKAGYRMVSAEDCFVHHFGQGAFSKIPPQQYQRIFEENRRRFEQKWGFSWVPHKYPPGIHGEGRRFTTAEFVKA